MIDGLKRRTCVQFLHGLMRANQVSRNLGQHEEDAG